MTQAAEQMRQMRSAMKGRRHKGWPCLQYSASMNGPQQAGAADERQGRGVKGSVPSALITAPQLGCAKLPQKRESVVTNGRRYWEAKGDNLPTAQRHFYGRSRPPHYSSMAWRFFGNRHRAPESPPTNSDLQELPPSDIRANRV